MLKEILKEISWDWIIAEIAVLSAICWNSLLIILQWAEDTSQDLPLSLLYSPSLAREEGSASGYNSSNTCLEVQPLSCVALPIMRQTSLVLSKTIFQSRTSKLFLYVFRVYLLEPTFANKEISWTIQIYIFCAYFSYCLSPSFFSRTVQVYNWLH